MLLPLLGACALVGPFQGPEWEPVRSLLSQDGRCRDLRCCGNLLVFCLFLIWQVQHYWHQLSKTRASQRKVVKVPPQEWAAPSVRYAAVWGPAPESFIGSSLPRGLDVHVQRWTRKQRWGFRRSPQKSLAQCLLSWQRQCQSPPGAHVPWESIFCTTSTSSTCLVTEDSSWCLSDRYTQLFCKPPPFALEKHHRVEQLLVCSPEEFTALGPDVSLRSHATAISLATSLPNLLSAQRLPVWSGEFLPVPSNQPLRIPTWQSRGCPQEVWAPERAKQTPGRGRDSGDHQAPRWGNQRESREGDPGEPRASGRRLPVDFGMEHDAQAEILGWGSWKSVIHETDGEILTPRNENQEHVGSQNRAEVQELRKRNQREARGKNPPETQVHQAEDQEQSRYKTDAEVQTPEWGNQDGSGGESAVEIQIFERKNKKEARRTDEGETQAQGLQKQGQTGGENGEETQMPGSGKEDHQGVNHGAAIQAEERRNKGRVGGEDTVHLQTPRRDNVGEVKQDGDMKTQELEQRKREWVGRENVPEIQPPGWENQDQGGRKRASGENEIKLRLEIPAGRSNQNLRKGEYARATRMSPRKKLQEIREEDWVVIQARHWGSWSVMASDKDREFGLLCWGNRGQIGAGGAEMWASEQRKQRGEEGAETWTPEADNQRQSRSEADVKTHPPGRRNQEQFGDGNGADVQAPRKRHLRGVKGQDGKKTQGLGEENQVQLSKEMNGMTHSPKWKNQGHVRSNNDANTQAFETQNWGKLITEIDGEAHSAGWKEEEEPERENSTEIQALEKKNQREARGEDGLETQRPERENQGQLDKETDGENDSPSRRNWGHPGGEEGAESQASEKRSLEEVGSENSMKIQRLEGENQRPPTSQVNGKNFRSEWKNQEKTGGETDEETQTQEKRNLKGTEGDDVSEIQAPGGHYPGELRSEINREIQGRGQENHKAGDAAEIQEAGSRRTCGSEDARRRQVPKDRNKNRLRRSDATKANLQVDPPVGEGPMGRNHRLAQSLVLTGFGCGAVTVNSSAFAPGPEMRHSFHWDEVLLLASQSTAPLWETQPESQRGQRKDKDVAPGKASALTKQPQNPQSMTALRVPSACPSVKGGPVTQAALAFAGTPTTLSVLPKRPVLKKSKRQLLESLMRRKIAHLKWGLPHRILQSYLLLNFLGPSCPLLITEVRQPGLYTGHEFKGQQRSLCEAQGSRPAPKPPEKPRRVKHPTQAATLEKHGPHWSEPQGQPIPPEKPRRPRPPEGARDPQAAQEEAPSRAPLSPPRHPKRAAESGSSCGQEGAGEPSTETSRDTNTARPGVSRMADRAPSRGRTSCSRAGHDQRRKECRLREAPKPLRCTLHRPPNWRRGSPESAKDRGAGQRPSVCSADTSSFKASLQSAAARLGRTLLNNMSWPPRLVQLQRSAPHPEDPDPTLLPKARDPHTAEGSTEVSTSLERDLQSPGHCSAGTPLPMTESPQDQGAPEGPNRAPWSPPAPPKFVFMKHLRSLLLHLNFRK